MNIYERRRGNPCFQVSILMSGILSGTAAVHVGYLGVREHDGTFLPKLSNDRSMSSRTESLSVIILYEQCCLVSKNSQTRDGALS